MDRHGFGDVGKGRVGGLEGEVGGTSTKRSIPNFIDSSGCLCEAFLPHPNTSPHPKSKPRLPPLLLFPNHCPAWLREGCVQNFNLLFLAS